MKLSLINEADRRGFLKQMFAAAASMPGVTDKIALDFARKAVSGSKFQIVGGYYSHWGKLDEYWKEFINTYKQLKSMVGDNKVYLVHDGGEGVDLVADLTPLEVIELTKRFGVEFNEEDQEEGNGLFLQIDGFEIFDDNPNNPYADRYEYSDEDEITPSNLLKQWWDKYESYGEAYMSKNFAGFLKRNGINPLRPNIAEVHGDNGYNSPEIRKQFTGTEKPEEWEGVSTNEPEHSEQIVPHEDDRLASSMHQPFESKLNKTLGHLLNEADVSRRKFLQLGGSFISSLTLKGINQSTAKRLFDLVNPSSSPQNSSSFVFAIQAESGYQNVNDAPDASDSYRMVTAAWANLKKIIGEKPIHMQNGFENGLYIETVLSPEEALKIIDKCDVTGDFSEHAGINLELNMNGRSAYLISSEDTSFDVTYNQLKSSPVVTAKNFIKVWWREWQKHSTKPISPQMKELLKRNGVNPQENLNSEENDYENDKLQEIVPHEDDRLASSMHQPFESKLDRALGLLIS